MNVENFIGVLNADFYSGVPDSLLKPLCNYLMANYGNNTKNHVIAANEGNAAAIAAGYHLATNKIPVVYMQNSGEGNIVNPVASLLSEKIYAVPMIFVIGWRSEPGIKDEPQHIQQGLITLKLLEVLGIDYFVVKTETTVAELETVMKNFRQILNAGKQVAFVICKNALTYDEKISYANAYKLRREDAIACIADFAADDVIISTTGKISRELFEIRTKNNQPHCKDFLTVGSMGHASSIALGTALQKTEKRVWCIDGDGAALMHLGAMAVIGANQPQNFIHVVLNNEAHESVGGLPTAAASINFSEIARACNYQYFASVDNLENLKAELQIIQAKKILSFIEVKVAIDSRKNLGRPTSTPLENKLNFMQFLSAEI